MLAIALQTTPDTPLAIAGTVGLFALFLSVTAHIAARNVLGDVEVKKAFAVGPVPAAIAFVFVAFSLPAAVGLALAVVADGLLVRYVYDQSTRLSVYITAIHLVVSVILGTIVFSLLVLASSAPV